MNSVIFYDKKRKKVGSWLPFWSLPLFNYILAHVQLKTQALLRYIFKYCRLWWSSPFTYLQHPSLKHLTCFLANDPLISCLHDLHEFYVFWYSSFTLFTRLLILLLSRTLQVIPILSHSFMSLTT